MTSPKKGKLTVYLGMAPGVGKTVAMLTSAKREQADGRDVVIGIVETHGRADTQFHTQGFEAIPTVAAAIGSQTVSEFNLDAAIARRPHLILVDELAHTNAPGSRHPKRWQDVIALLSAGIDVSTTINIQHIESHRDDVAAITGITMDETVPDHVIDQADEIRLIDLDADRLLERLKTGLIYPMDRVPWALAHFFKPAPLAGLRELALRYTAEKVDRDLHATAAFQTRGKLWGINDRILVAFGPSPGSGQLIRMTRRLAASLGAQWVAMVVDTGIALSDADTNRLKHHIQLVQDLGGDLISVSDTDPIAAIRRVVTERNIARVVTGRSNRQWWQVSQWTLSNRLVRELSEADVIVVRSTAGLGTPRWQPLRFARVTGSGWRQAGVALLVTTLLGWAIAPVVGYQAVGFLFLLAIIGIAAVASTWVIGIATLVAMGIWNVGFIPPLGTWTITKPGDLALLITFGVVAAVTGYRTAQRKAASQLIQRQARYTEWVLTISTLILNSNQIDPILPEINRHLSQWFGIQLTLGDNTPPSDLPDPASVRAYQWAVAHRQRVGWMTDTLPTVPVHIAPMTYADRNLGLAVIRPTTTRPILPRDWAIVTTILDLVIRARYQQQLADDLAAAQRDQATQAVASLLINCISHELKTPITAIKGNMDWLRQHIESTDVTDVISDVTHDINRLNQVVDTVLDMSRLESGYFEPHFGPVSLADVVTDAKSDLIQPLAINLPDSDPVLIADWGLMSRVMSNLFRNAVAAGATQIQIHARQTQSDIQLDIHDNGPGIPAALIPDLFTRFNGARFRKTGGIGLGLALCKGLMALQNGDIQWVPTQSGACFKLTLPIAAKMPTLSA